MGDRTTPRRAMLATVGGVAVAAVSGCLDETGDAEEPTAGEEGDETTEPGVTEDASFSIVAEYPVETDEGISYREETVVTADDVASVGPVQEGRSGRQPGLTVTLEETTASEFAATMRETGFTDEGIANCRHEQSPEDPGYCLHTVVDGEEVASASVGAHLATTLENGEFEADPSFRITTATYEEAERIREELVAGGQ